MIPQGLLIEKILRSKRQCYRGSCSRHINMGGKICKINQLNFVLPDGQVSMSTENGPACRTF